jgi:hypothetical protein
MARTANIQSVIDSFLARIGTQVAQGVSDGITKSGLLAQIRSAGVTASNEKGRLGRKRGPEKKCSEKGCDLPARARGLCVKHYQQARYAEKHGAAKPAKTAGKKGRPPKAAKKVPKRIAPKKSAPRKLAPKKAKSAPVVANPGPAPETKE